MPLAERWVSTSLGMVSQFIISGWDAASASTSAVAGEMAGKRVRRQRGQVFLLSCEEGESQVERHAWPNSWLQGRRTASSGGMALLGMVVL